MVTELKPFYAFYEAESKHHDFYKKHQKQPYCRIIIEPKIQKLNTFAPDKLK